jgi:hypothetical protein
MLGQAAAFLLLCTVNRYLIRYLSYTLLLTCKGGGSPSLSEDSWGVNCRTGVASVPSEHHMIIVSVTVNDYIFIFFINNHVHGFFLAYHWVRPRIPKIPC